MAQESDQPRPHGDQLDPMAGDNPAQRQSDALPDANAGDRPDDLTGASDRAGGRGSTANGVPQFDEDAGDLRRKQYRNGAELVSGTD